MNADKASAENHNFVNDSGDKIAATELENSPTKDEGAAIDHGADTQLHRSLGTRHLTMIALGSAIGMGMWLGSGTSLINGGSASLFIGFLISSSMNWAVSQPIGGMAGMYLLTSAFVQWSTMFLSPAARFALGWGYRFSYWITIANDLQVYTYCILLKDMGNANLALKALSQFLAIGLTKSPRQHGYPSMEIMGVSLRCVVVIGLVSAAYQCWSFI